MRSVENPQRLYAAIPIRIWKPLVCWAGFTVQALHGKIEAHPKRLGRVAFLVQ